MATTSPKLKPVAPPKPLANLNIQSQAESRTQSVGDDFTESKDKMLRKDNNTMLNLKTDKEGNIINIGKGNCKVVTSSRSSGTLPPKPALLPKPQSPAQKFPPKERPKIPRRPETVLSPVKKSLDVAPVKRSATTLSLMPTRAPVAKLEEFDSLYGSQANEANPTRPPRSPKIKLFPGGPFCTKEGIDEKPELPAKKRPFTCIDKKKSLSLGRGENIMHLDTQLKSMSLVRNLNPCTEMGADTSPLSSSLKPLPVPPPRRRKKSEDMASQLAGITTSPVCKIDHDPPIYAQVNYEMKKNRRGPISPDSLATQSGDLKNGSNDQEEIIQGRLLLTKDNVETNCCPLVDSETGTELLSVNYVDSPHPEGGYNTTADSVIFTDNMPQGTDSRIDLPIQNEETRAEEGCIDREAKTTMSDMASTTLLPRESKLYQLHERQKRTEACNLEAKTKADASLVVDNSLTNSSVNSVHDFGVAATSMVPTDANTSFSPIPISSELFPINKEKKVIQEVTSQSCTASETTTSDTAYEATSGILCEARNSTLYKSVESKSTEIYTLAKLNKRDEQGNPKPLSTVTYASEVVLEQDIQENGSENAINLKGTKTWSAEYGKSGDKLAGESRLWRRQSWSSSKDTTPSPERGSVRKQGHWCDEGDLSNGALADSDSSDNMGRKATEEAEVAHKSKIVKFPDYFGRGSKRKEKKQRESSSLFPNSEVKKYVKVNKMDISRPSIERPIYTESAPGLEDGTDDLQLSNNATEVPHVQVETCSEAADSERQGGSIKRSPSGVSDILDNLGSSPAFDGERDSESENEERVTEVLCQLSPGQKRKKKLFFVAQELMTSEQQFVDVLKLINVDFIEAVNKAGIKDSSVIPDSELSKIVNSLPQLQGFNEELLKDLETRIENWSSNPKIADIIIKKGPFLKLYSTYIKNFESQCSYLDECCQKYPRFAKVVKEFEASAVCKKLELKHFMLKPVQRIPQYRLLLEDYQHHLDPSSPEAADTEAALKIVRDVADHANRSLKLGDHLCKLIELQSQLVNYEIIRPGRIYIKDGELLKLSRKVRHPRYFILLSDCLLYTSKLNPTQIRVSKELPLHGMVVSIPQIADDLNEFNIVSMTRSFTLSASSQGERQEWVDALENAIKEDANRKGTFLASKLASQSVLRLGYRPAVWIPDDRVTMCQSCTTPFTLTSRRHHCRACGKIFCGLCSDNEAPLRFDGYRKNRVCDDCHDILILEFEGPEAENIKHDLMAQENFRNMSESAAFNAAKALFKINGSGNKKKPKLSKDIPKRLKEVAANDSGSHMSGWLHRRGRRSWKRLWFVLKDQILYVYKASEDVAALESIPILGYKVEPMAERHFQVYEGIDAALVFQLTHVGQTPFVFHAATVQLANRWMATMGAATILE